MQSQKELQQAQKAAGRLNWNEYSKLTGKPIPQDAAPTPTKNSKTAQSKDRIKAARKITGRINVAELAALERKKTRAKRNGKKTVKRVTKRVS